jgi:hypothetical protein
MENQMDNPKDAAKKPYEKPEAKRFPLRPEEAVLGNCKSSNSGGTGQGNCAHPGACSGVGS